MKIYRDPKNSLRMGVCNFNRVDEEKLFHSALDTMKKANDTNLGEEKEYPYCRMVEGKCPVGGFTVIFDFVEGTEIACDNEEKFDFLKNILE